MSKQVKPVKLTLPNNFRDERRYLIQRHAFYGLPSMGSFIKLDPSIPTACTDGRTIFISPNFLHRMPVPHVATVVAHECIHIICDHPSLMAKGVWPDGTKILHKQVLNQAMDFWANGNLQLEGFEFPTTIKACIDSRYKGWSIRKIYDHLVQNMPPQPPPPPGGGGCGGGDENGDGNGEKDDDDDGVNGRSPGDMNTGQDIIARVPSNSEDVERNISLRQAYAIAKSQGTVPAWIEQLIEEIKEPRLSYKELLQSFLTQERQHLARWAGCLP